jgi:hypothetical protein
MPTNISDLVNTFVNFGQYQLQKRQVADQEKNAQIAAINSFMNMAKQTADPTQLTALVQQFSSLGVASPEQLTSILQNITPSTEVQQAGQTQRGIRVAEGQPSGKGAEADQLARQAANQTLTGRDAGQLATADFLAKSLAAAGPPSADLAAATAARLGPGMTPSQLVFDHLRAMMNPSQQQQMINIEGGLAPNAAQTMQNQTQVRGQNLQHDEALQNLNLNWGQLNESNRHNRAGEAATISGLELQGQQIDNEFKAAIARANSSGDEHLPQLLQIKEQVQKQLSDKNAKLTPTLIISAIGILNSVNQQLQAMGKANEGQLPYNPDVMVDPGWWANYFNTRQPIIVRPQYFQQQQQQRPDTTRKP